MRVACVNMLMKEMGLHYVGGIIYTNHTRGETQIVRKVHVYNVEDVSYSPSFVLKMFRMRNYSPSRSLDVILRFFLVHYWIIIEKSYLLHIRCSVHLIRT